MCVCYIMVLQRVRIRPSDIATFYRTMLTAHEKCTEKKGRRVLAYVTRSRRISRLFTISSRNIIKLR